MGISRQEDSLTTGRANQKLRTRRALVEAAVRLSRQGRPLVIPDVAREALVSTATAYRYFPTPRALTVEVASRESQHRLDEALAGMPADPEQRIDALVSTIADFQLENEALWLAVLGAVLERRLAELAVPERDRVPVRGGHRMEAVRAALAPLAETLPADQHRRLTMATMLVCGVEALSSCRGACELDPEETVEVMRWAARALQRQAVSETVAEAVSEHAGPAVPRAGSRPGTAG